MSDPIFKSVFCASWDKLPPVLKKHYANRPYTDDETTVEGTLDVACNQPLKFLAPLLRLMGQVPAINERDVPVTVKFRSDKGSRSFHFDRRFHFAGAKPYVFRSYMIPVNGNKVIEVMRFGFGWKMTYRWDGKNVILEHVGYVTRVFGIWLPLPMTMILGAGYAEETAVDDDTFEMITHITHPWWGRVYEYRGRFKFV